MQGASCSHLGTTICYFSSYTATETKRQGIQSRKKAKYRSFQLCLHIASCYHDLQLSTMHARYTYIQFTSTPLNNTQIDCIHCIQHCPVLKGIPSDPGWARTATKRRILGSLSRTTMHRAAKRATMRRAAESAADTIFFL